MQVGCAEIAILSQYLAPPGDVTNHGKLMTLVAGKQRSLLMAGDDDEVYDEKPQRYTEDNRTAFNCTQW